MSHVGHVSLIIGATTYSPTFCADSINNGNPTQEAANLNTALGTTGFVYLDKTDASGQTLSGINFTVTAPPTNSGTWTVAWLDTNGAAPLNLPITIDFEVGLFGGNNGAGYFFDNVLLPIAPSSGTGSFDINFANHGGQQPDLSHLTLTGGNAVHVDTPPVPAPEPTTMAILGLAWPHSASCAGATLDYGGMQGRDPRSPCMCGRPASKAAPRAQTAICPMPSELKAS